MKNCLRVLRAERRWTQADLGARIGVSRNSVIAIESGRYDPSLRLAFKIAEISKRGSRIFFRKKKSSRSKPHCLPRQARLTRTKCVPTLRRRGLVSRGAEGTMAGGKITERRAREIAEAELRRLESHLRPAGTPPTYDLHIVSMQACRHGWMFPPQCARMRGGASLAVCPRRARRFTCATTGAYSSCRPPIRWRTTSAGSRQRSKENLSILRYSSPRTSST